MRVVYGAAERTLAARRNKQVCVFRRMESVVTYLRSLGIDRFKVDGAGVEREGGRTRSDRAHAMQRPHGSAAYDKWFREEVEAGLREADDPKTEWVPHEVVKQDIAAQRAQLQARIKNEAL